jgi:hypothetical protein
MSWMFDSTKRVLAGRQSVSVIGFLNALGIAALGQAPQPR